MWGLVGDVGGGGNVLGPNIFLEQSVATYTTFFFFFKFFFRAAPMAHGSFQARGQIGTAATGLCHSHSNTGSESSLPPTLQLIAGQIPNPLSEARDQTHILMDTSWICFCCATMGTRTFFRLRTNDRVPFVA